MLACYNKLPKEMQKRMLSSTNYESLLQNSLDALDAIRHIEHICKNKGFSCKTVEVPVIHIVAHVMKCLSSSSSPWLEDAGVLPKGRSATY